MFNEKKNKDTTRFLLLEYILPGGGVFLNNILELSLDLSLFRLRRTKSDKWVMKYFQA